MSDATCDASDLARIGASSQDEAQATIPHPGVPGAFNREYGPIMAVKIDLDLKGGFLQSLKREVLSVLDEEERAVIETSTGELGNKPDAVKLGWLRMRTKQDWTKQRYVKTLNRAIEKLRKAAEQTKKKA